MKRFLKSMFRNIRRNTLFSAINLSGLVLGFGCIVIIAVWIKNELSYDRFHKNSNSIYRVHRYFYDANGAENLHLPRVAPQVGPLLKKEFSDIQHICRVVQTGMVFNLGDQKMTENKVCFAEPDVIKVFTFEGLPGDSSLLIQPLTAIISQEIANKYFPPGDAIGKILEFKDDNGEMHALQITGVFKKWKQSSHFNPDIFISFSTLEAAVGPEELQDWSSNNYETYALIPFLPSDMNQKLDAFIDKHLDDGTKWTKIRLEPLTDIHFNWYSNRSYIFILTSIALLILVLGSINYTNLNAAMYLKQLRDIKVIRIIGASRKELILKLISESVIFCLAALIIALYVAYSFLPIINKTLNNSLEFRLPDNFMLVLGFVVLAVFTGIISSIYPAFMLPSLQSGINKTSDISGNRRSSFRNSLVVFQFVVSITLIIAFIQVSKQLHFLYEKDLGLDKENVVVIPTTPLLVQKLDVFKQKLTQNTHILAVSASKRVPSDGLWDNSDARIGSGNNSTPLGFRLPNVRMDDQFISVYKIKLIAGRNFHENIANDPGYIINETAVKKIGWKSPEDAVGQIMVYGGRQASVIGIVQDFHYESLHNPLSPIIMYYEPSDFNFVSVRISSSEIKSTLAFIEKTWQEYNNVDHAFSYEFLSDRYNSLYQSEENIRSIFIYCMVIAVFIAILGLIGLSLSLTERRTKEIGIRKVNGAKTIEVWKMLNTDFVKWVLIAFVLACPIAWFVLHKWLQNFAYRTTQSWWVFAAAGAVAVTVAVLTVSWQSWRAATRNPVEALRYE